MRRKHFPCAVVMNFVENLGAQIFFAYRDFKKANNCICLCSSRMERQFFINRLCMFNINFQTVILMLVYIFSLLSLTFCARQILILCAEV